MKTPQDRIAALEARINTLAVKALSLQLSVSKSDFKESEHPRADDGKFGQGSGGGKKETKESESKPSKKPEETKEQRQARHMKEMEDEDRQTKENEERHQRGIDAKHFPAPSSEDVESERQSAKYIVDEVLEFGNDAGKRQYEGILRDIKRGENGDGTSDYSFIPGRMIALKEEYEKRLKL